MKKLLALSLMLFAAAQFSIAQDVEETPDSIAAEVSEELTNEEVPNTDSENMDEQQSNPSEQIAREIFLELGTELENWTEEDLREMLSESGNASGGGKGVSFGESIIAIIALTFTVGMPVIIVGIVAYSGYRKKRLMHDTINKYVDSEREIPPQVLESLTAASKPKNNLESGLVLVGVGVGLIIFFSVVGAEEGVGIGAIPLCIGLAKLVLWKLDKSKQVEDQSNG